MSEVVKEILVTFALLLSLDIGIERKEEFGKQYTGTPKFLEFDSNRKEMISEIQHRFKNNDTSSCEICHPPLF